MPILYFGRTYMIIRIKIDGFKSLLNTELYFGPFTCIAGANAVGKSNFFDALQFLSKLADTTILQAAKSIRSENQKHSDIKDIFFKRGTHYYDKMSFEVDMLVAQKANDDLGQEALASITSLRYSLELKLNEEIEGKEPIEIAAAEQHECYSTTGDFSNLNSISQDPAQPSLSRLLY